jgi:mannose-1-phosphate guanylyltransferase
MFAWQNEVILEQFRHHLPAHLTTLEPAIEGRVPLAQAFERLEKISIDFAILEKAPDVRCVIPSFSWSDLGGWLALQPFLQEDQEKNHGRGHIYSFEAQRNLVVCQDPEETVALLGVSDLVVVRVGKKTLVVPKSRTEEIKQLLARMPAEELR